MGCSPEGSRAINSVGECHLHTVEVTGSNPVSPTTFEAHHMLVGALSFAGPNDPDTPDVPWGVGVSALRRALSYAPTYEGFAQTTSARQFTALDLGSNSFHMVAQESENGLLTVVDRLQRCGSLRSR